MEIERTIVEGYFEGSDQKITISNILSLSFGLIGLFLIVHGLIRKKFNSKTVFISKITVNRKFKNFEKGIILVSESVDLSCMLSCH